MFRASALVDVDVLDAVHEALRDAPGLMTTAYKRVVRRVRQPLLAELRQEPGSPRYPLRWKSQRQRRFVMAKLRREGNIPYQRTHGLANAWRIEVEDIDVGSAVITIDNPLPEAQFVIGDFQQPLHIDTGWKPAAQTLVKYEEILQDQFIEAYFTVTDPFAGVPQ